MNEFQLIREFFTGWQDAGGQPLLGIGDDAALVQIPVGKELVVAADTLVEGRHFPKNSDPAKIASRALRVNLSDMAAMGATPLHYTLCLTLPASDTEWLRQFAGELRVQSKLFNCSLIGGDTTRGELCISLQLLGLVQAGGALKRSAAQIGDMVWVTGTLGDAAAFVAANFSEETKYASAAERFWSPQPRLAFASQAASLINACIDVSDGLLADLGHICEASCAGAELTAAAIPMSGYLQSLPSETALGFALSGGDDYELCFTAKAEHETALKNMAAANNLRLSPIGRITAGDRVICLNDAGVDMASEQRGYSHF